MSSAAVFRGADGREVSLDLAVPIPYYSTAEFGSDVDPRLDLFGYVAGDLVPSAGTVPAPNRTSTIADTNVTSAGMLDTDQELDVYALSYELFGLTNTPPVTEGTSFVFAPAVAAYNVRRLQRDIVMSLKTTAMNTKVAARYPLSQVAQGAGPEIMGVLGSAAPSATGPGASAPVGIGGSVNPAASPRWRIPVHIAGGQSYTVEFYSERSPKNDISNPRHDQALMVRVYLVGMSTRPGTSMGVLYES